MAESARRPRNEVVEPRQRVTSPAVSNLIAELASGDGAVRQRARSLLVEMGGPAVGPLTGALEEPDGQVRWEAAKALGEIGDAALPSAPALVRTLEDPRRDVRWLAAQALIELGRAGLDPLLETVAHRAASRWLREGAHQVLHAVQGDDLDEIVSPVLGALEGAEPALVAPNAAFQSLEVLRRG